MAIIQKILETIAWCLLGLIGFLITTGGFYLGRDKRIEIASLDPWVLALLLILGGLWVLTRSQKLPRIFDFLRSTFLKFQSQPTHFAWLFLAISMLLLTFAHFLRHSSGHTDAYDLLFLHQPLFDPWSRPFLRCDICLAGTYFGEHLSFTLWLLAPLTWVTQSDFLIFVIQSLMGAGAITILLKHGPLRARPYLFLSVIFFFMCQRGFRNAFVWDFREDHLGFLFQILLLVSLDRGHTLGAWFTLALVLLTKEHLAFSTFLLAIPILWDSTLSLDRSQRRSLAFGFFILSAAWAMFSFSWIIPRVSGGLETENNITARFSHLGSTPIEVLIRILTSPSVWWDLATSALNKSGIKYLLWLVLPFAVFFRKTWMWWIPAFPLIVMNLVSGATTQRAMIFHYELAILPYLFFAALKGLNALRIPPTGNHWPHRTWTTALILGLLVSGRWPGESIQRHWPTSEESAAREELHSMIEEFNLDRPKTIVAADLRTLAQLTDLSNLRQIILPETSAPLPWAKLKEINQKDRTRIPGHNAFQAKYWILNLRQPRGEELARTCQTDPDCPYFPKNLGAKYYVLLESKVDSR